MIKLFLPVFDYFKTRRCVILKFIWPTIAAAVYLLIVAFIPVQEGGSLRQFFTDFISSQISIVAIFISFSIAIISILVSADNDNIKRLKSTEAKDGRIKPLKDTPLTLFQVLLTNLAYNVFVEVIYLFILIVFTIIKAIIPEAIFVYLTALGIFFIIHILHVLLETVVQMYLTFWRK